MVKIKMTEGEKYRHRMNNILNKEFLKKNPKSICENCGTKKNLTIHHIIPKSEGGLDEPSNYQILCRNCHDKVHEIISNPKTKGHWAYSQKRLLLAMIQNCYSMDIICKALSKPESKIKLMIKKMGLKYGS